MAVWYFHWACGKRHWLSSWVFFFLPSSFFPLLCCLSLLPLCTASNQVLAWANRSYIYFQWETNDWRQGSNMQSIELSSRGWVRCKNSDWKYLLHIELPWKLWLTRPQINCITTHLKISFQTHSPPSYTSAAVYLQKLRYSHVSHSTSWMATYWKGKMPITSGTPLQSDAFNHLRGN